jgi:hypothetical protein
MSATLTCSRGIIRRLSNFQGAKYRRFGLRRLCPSNGPEQGNVQRFVPACLAPDSPACRRRYRHARSESNPFQLRRSRAAARASVSQKSLTRFTLSWSVSLTLTANLRLQRAPITSQNARVRQKFQQSHAKAPSDTPGTRSKTRAAHPLAPKASSQ